MPGSKSITYTYDQKGRLIRLSDWDGQTTSFTYDKADRHVRTRRSNGLDSLYQHDAAGRLRTLHHLQGRASLRQTFNYTVNALGNRTQAQEVTPRTSGATATTMSHDYPALVYRGDWNDIGSYHEATVHDASVSMLFYGETATLTMGKNDDCSLFDIYLDGTLWLSFDGYAATASDLTISIDVEGTGLHLLEVKNRLEHNRNSSAYKLRFKSLYAQPAFDVTQIDYEYDDISRLIEADYDSGTTVYSYGYDLAGNLVNNDGTTRTYNAANQMTNDGTNTLTYDDNGNLTNDGVNALTWDRANRMLTAPSSTSYAYDGLGNRIQQTVSSVVTDYLNDVQSGLVKVLRQADGTNTDFFVHGIRGIHAVDDGTDWTWYTQDGLGSVRGIVDSSADIVTSHAYNPIGVPDSDYGAGFWFTGEQTDENDNIYLRARYMNPNMGTFLSLDPFEGVQNRPMSLNGYSWVEGNVPNMVDPSGRCVEDMVYFIGLGIGMGGFFSPPFTPPMQENGASREPLCGCYFGILARFDSNSDWNRCQRGELEPCTEPAREYCERECEGNVLDAAFITMDSLASCYKSCFATVANARIRYENDHTIEFYTSNADYYDAAYDADTHNTLVLFQPEHSFIVAWHESTGIAYAGGPGEEPLTILDDTPTCGGIIRVGSEAAGDRDGNGAQFEGQYYRWLSNPWFARTGPSILLGGREAEEAKSCLDAKVNLMQIQIERDQTPYCPVQRNSNTVAFTLMRQCNIPGELVALSTWLPGRYDDLFG